MPAWILGVGAAVAVSIVIGRWLTDANRKLRNEIKSTPVVPLSHAPENETTRICGTLELIDPANALIAPISRRPCAAWRVVVWRLEGGENKTWRKRLETDDSQSFHLRDGDELAYVEGTSLELLLHADERAENRFFSELPAEADEFLIQHGLDLRGLLLKQTYRVHEGVLEAGERVTVVGVGEWEADPTRRGQGYRDVGRRFHVREMPDGRLLASDEIALTSD